MRILVTGGAGFIGSNFLSRFVPRLREHEFLNADKLAAGANPLSLESIAGLPNYRFAQIDLADAHSTNAIVSEHRPDLVVHFAAESHVDRSIDGPRAFLESNVIGTFNLLEACRAIWRPGTGLLHHVSTDEVYGSLGETGSFDESSAYDPSSPYSATKAASDHLVRAWARTFGIPMKITHCTNNYGPRQAPEKLIPLTILRCLEGRSIPIYGRGINVRDWLYVDDHCAALWAVIERGRVGQTYAIGGNNEVKNIDVVDRICRLVATEIGVDARELLALRTFVADRPGHDLRYAVDTTKVRTELGWQPQETFESGLRRTVRWYLANAEWIGAARQGLQWVPEDYEQRRGAA